MIVSMWMTRNPVAVEPHTSISESASLMALKRIRRLPVVEKRPDGPHLVGIITDGNILHAFPPNVNPFAVLEPNTPRSLVTVAHIMSTELRTTTPDMPIEDAAALMTDNKIGSLPVVHEGKLVGIITESDIFRAFVGFFSPPHPGARITFDTSKGEDVFGWISNEARTRKIQVTSLISSQQENLPVCVVGVSGSGVEAFLEDIWNSGHRVLNVIRFE